MSSLHVQASRKMSASEKLDVGLIGFWSPSKKAKTSTRSARTQFKAPTADTEKCYQGHKNILQVDS